MNLVPKDVFLLNNPIWISFRLIKLRKFHILKHTDSCTKMNSKFLKFCITKVYRLPLCMHTRCSLQYFSWVCLLGRFYFEPISNFILRSLIISKTKMQNHYLYLTLIYLQHCGFDILLYWCR